VIISTDRGAYTDLAGESSSPIESEPRPSLMGDREDQVSGTPIVDSGAFFACTPVRLWDGDGPIWCNEGPRVRLAGINARETDGTCSPGHPCPSASADDATVALAALLGETVGRAEEGHLLIKGPTLSCKSTGGALGERTGGWCVSPLHGDLACALLDSGTVARWPKYWGSHSCNSAIR
jgi:hypothetical protein